MAIITYKDDLLRNDVDVIIFPSVLWKQPSPLDHFLIFFNKINYQGAQSFFIYLSHWQGLL